MKHSMLQVVKVIPYPTGEALVIDRQHFLSAILGVLVGDITGAPTAVKLKVSLLHSDTEDGEYTEVEDPMKYIGAPLPAVVEAGTLYNLDIDLLGCKRYVKASATVELEGGTNPAAAVSCALALGDKTSNPV